MNNLKYNIIKELKTNKATLISLITFTVLILMILIVPLLYPANYFTFTDYDSMNQAPSFKHIFGTDYLGRDLFIRVLEASKLSLEIALISAIVVVTIGTIYGVISGFYGGKLDSIMMRVVDGLYSLPFIFLCILLSAIFGRNFYLIFVSIACVSWLDVARVVRGQTLEIKNKEYIEAAKLMGLSNTQIIYKHIIHNLRGTILIFMTLTIPSILYTSTFLGFLGFGVQPPYAGLGELISEGSGNISIGYWWTLLFPCLFMILLLLCLNFISNGIKNIFDNKS